jgi:simple sugar transport system substrate-binding protein
VTNAICFNQQQGQLTLETRCRGFDQGLGGTVEQIATTDADPTQIRNAISSALRNNPDVNGVLTLGPSPAEQALRAIREAGMEDQVQVGTFDISPAVLEAVRDGDLLFAIDQQMFGQTYWSVVFLSNYVQWLLNPVQAVPTGPNFVTEEKAQQIIDLAAQGIH